MYQCSYKYYKCSQVKIGKLCGGLYIYRLVTHYILHHCSTTSEFAITQSLLYV